MAGPLEDLAAMREAMAKLADMVAAQEERAQRASEEATARSDDQGERTTATYGQPQAQQQTQPVQQPRPQPVQPPAAPQARWPEQPRQQSQDGQDDRRDGRQQQAPAPAQVPFAPQGIPRLPSPPSIAPPPLPPAPPVPVPPGQPARPVQSATAGPAQAAAAPSGVMTPSIPPVEIKPTVVMTAPQGPALSSSAPVPPPPLMGSPAPASSRSPSLMPASAHAPAPAPQLPAPSARSTATAQVPQVPSFWTAPAVPPPVPPRQPAAGVPAPQVPSVSARPTLPAFWTAPTTPMAPRTVAWGPSTPPPPQRGPAAAPATATPPMLPTTPSGSFAATDPLRARPLRNTWSLPQVPTTPSVALPPAPPQQQRTTGGDVTQSALNLFAPEVAGKFGQARNLFSTARDWLKGPQPPAAPQGLADGPASLPPPPPQAAAGGGGAKPPGLGDVSQSALNMFAPELGGKFAQARNLFQTAKGWWDGRKKAPGGEQADGAPEIPAAPTGLTGPPPTPGADMARKWHDAARSAVPSTPSLTGVGPAGGVGPRVPIPGQGGLLGSLTSQVPPAGGGMGGGASMQVFAEMLRVLHEIRDALGKTAEGAGHGTDQSQRAENYAPSMWGGSHEHGGGGFFAGGGGEGRLTPPTPDGKGGFLDGALGAALQVGSFFIPGGGVGKALGLIGKIPGVSKVIAPIGKFLGRFGKLAPKK